jgi:hypothetical protein
MIPQEPIVGDSGLPIYHSVTRPTQGLSFANGNDATTQGWGNGKSPVIQPVDPVDMDDPFQHTKNEKVDLYMYELQDHMNRTWHDAIREATVWDPLYYHTVQRACNGEDESQWQILGRILYQKGEGDADCIYISPTTHSNGLNIRDEIMYHTHEKLTHFRPNKCHQYSKVYFFWYSIHQDFVDFCCRCHLCQVNKIPTKVPEDE